MAEKKNPIGKEVAETFSQGFRRALGIKEAKGAERPKKKKAKRKKAKKKKSAKFTMSGGLRGSY